MTKKKFNDALATEIRTRRENGKLTQAGLGKRIGISGAWISHFEAGRRAPSTFIFWKLQRALDINWRSFNQ